MLKRYKLNVTKKMLKRYNEILLLKIIRRFLRLYVVYLDTRLSETLHH